MNQELYRQIDELQDEYLQIWEDVTAIESPSDCKEGVDAVGRFFAQRGAERGWKVEMLPQVISGNAICITLNPDVSERPVAISGHMDTVHPVGSFSPPAVWRDAQKIYGPGILDCKSGVVLGFLLLDVLDRCNYRKRPVKLLLQSDEEVGSRTSDKATIRWICQQAQDAIAFFNLENSNEGMVTVSRRGIARYRFDITGKAAHSALCQKGANAITQAAHMIIELEKFKDPNTITCNCGLIEGGTASNVVPEVCTFTADIRYTTQQDLNNAQQKIRQIADTVYTPGCAVHYRQISDRPSMPVIPRNLELLEKINCILSSNGLSGLIPKNLLSGSDAAYVSAAGIPCLDSMGVRGGGVHSKQEFAWIDSMWEAARLLSVILWHI